MHNQEQIPAALLAMTPFSIAPSASVRCVHTLPFITHLYMSDLSITIIPHTVAVGSPHANPQRLPPSPCIGQYWSTDHLTRWPWRIHPLQVFWIVSDSCQSSQLMALFVLYGKVKDGREWIEGVAFIIRPSWQIPCFYCHAPEVTS